MKEHIIRAVLYEDMSVKWKNAEEDGGINTRLNVHQKTRQFVELELGDFILSNGEAILAAFEHTKDGETNHINPSLMQKIDGEENAYRIQIPLLVHSTPGEWGVQFFVATNYAAGEYDHAYPSNKVYFLEGSSFVDDGLTIPSGEDFNALYAAATDAKVIATGAKDEAVDANIEAQAARLEIVGEDGNGGVLATIKENSEKIEASRAETEELAANAAASAKSAADSEALALQHRMDYTPKIEQNSRDIANLYAINEQNGQFARLKVAQAYASRVTADGANIFDDQLTPVLEIAGSTVKTTNLFDISKMSAGSSGTTTHTDRDITVTDYFAATNTNLKNLIPNLQIGKTYTFCCKEVVSDVELLYNRGGTYIYSSSTGSISMCSRTSLKKAITIDENLYNNGQLGFWGNPIDAGGGKVTWKEFQVLEGDWTDKEVPEWTPYFTGLKHANINSIVSTGKNLFDKDSANLGYELGSQGQLVATASWFVSDYIPVVGEETIVINGKPDTGAGNAFYDADKNFISMINLSIGKLTVPQGARYYRFNSSQAYLDTAIVSRNEYIPYEPYKQSVFQLPQTVELGEYDKILPQTGEIVRNTKKVVLTGDNDVDGIWRDTGVTTDGTGHIFYISGAYSADYNKEKAFCNLRNYYPSGLFVWENLTAGEFGITSGGTLVMIADGTETTLAQWKAYLAELNSNGTPMIIEYGSTVAQQTETINSPKVYTAWNGGSETIVQGETDNSQFGAMPTVTQTYFGKVGEE